MYDSDDVLEFSGRGRIFSNFWPCKISYAGILFPSVEHAFQACKSSRRDERRRFSKLRTPVDAKREGRKLKLRKDWEKIKDGIMLCLLRKKFSIPALAEDLINTGNSKLVESNWWGDTYWGVCNGVGKNKLGKMLMKIRKELQ